MRWSLTCPRNKAVEEETEEGEEEETTVEGEDEEAAADLRGDVSPPLRGWARVAEA